MNTLKFACYALTMVLVLLSSAGKTQVHNGAADHKVAPSFARLVVLLERDINKVPSHLEQMVANPSTPYVYIADAIELIQMKKGLTARMYSAIAKGQEKLLENPCPEQGFGGKTIVAYQNLAATYTQLGETEKAVASIGKAIEIANRQSELELSIMKP